MKNRKKLIITIAIAAVVISFFRTLSHPGLLLYGSHIKEVLVSRVIDGDTIELSDGRTVRYIGIDTPEIREKNNGTWSYKPMPYSEEAREFNRDLVEGKAVKLEFDVQKLDKYDRILAYVHVGDRMVNLEMLSRGYAMMYTYPPNVKYSEMFLKAQDEAREARRGLWAGVEENIISPKDTGENIGFVRIVQATIISTYISEKALILNCGYDFKIVIFRNNFSLFPKEAIRSPDSYFRNKAVRVYGIIKKYKGSKEIIINDSSQLRIL
ncbi:MAG: thermonuclease family protein [Candidatus Omnitrophica bacterium]|nr:thermonuclease family protein [Candidatus Omnitrophota bacterium]MBU1932498.1 thermonuclease family protein [Candidatus Omnitrophota bacterium]